MFTGTGPISGSSSSGMTETGQQLVNPEPRTELLEKCLFLDLEINPQGQILKVGAVLGDRSLGCAGSSRVDSLLQDLALFSRDAKILAGHNLLRHDLPNLGEQYPNHPLLSLPVVDTLVLSPICFPQNPYHRLVKDYKLVTESVNDPVADARLAGTLLRDEIAALGALGVAELGVFDLLHYLLTASQDEEDQSSQGLGLLFAIFERPKLTAEEALHLAKQLLPRWGCREFSVTPVLFGEWRMAFAFTLAWLRVAGATSVLPPWVRAQHPKVLELIAALRDTSCGKPDCTYCQKYHNSREQLQAFFGFSGFRATPENKAGGSLQLDIIEAGMRNESLLAILPTGGGKSICFQLPALVRNFRRGALTIVISPLQSLMKDQVDGLQRRTGTPFAAALYGMLTPPERGEVLRRVRMGDIAILYVSPEQLRNRSFKAAISQREIGCWVFDESHCLSKWGHDFRSDYLYAGRFIREFSAEHHQPIPPVACFTATAKRDVKEEILSYFTVETGQILSLYEGGVQRDNLQFEVQPISTWEKLERVEHLLAQQFSHQPHGTAIVFRSTRGHCEQTSQFLKNKEWRAAHFHAGLSPSEKKQIQDDFLAGNIQIICATNAFGMGIDKENVRLVIHADTPGSLENYLQEAGRAGRDQKRSQCVLLCDQADTEWQFRMSARSELTRRDISQILRTLRKARRRQEELVITTGEILRDEEFEGDFDLEDLSADTKVRTAISWLERADFLRRDENVSNVFQARLLVKDLPEAETKMAALNLSASEQALWRAILLQIMNTPPAQSLTVDQIALLPEFQSYLENSPAPENSLPGSNRRRSHDYLSGKILKILRAMDHGGLLKKETLMTALVHYKVANHSGIRLQKSVTAERQLLDLLTTAEPDPEGWMVLSLPLLNQGLLDEGVESSPELIRKLLASLAEDGRGFAGGVGSIELRHFSRESYRVKLNRPWSIIGSLAEKRWRIAEVILETLLGKVPASTPPAADVLVSFSYEELEEAISQDLLLRSEVAPSNMDSALDRGLSYLREHGVISLQNGLAIFRSAMTIRFCPGAAGEKYRASHYEPLAHYYKERIFQVHVMGEYARRAMQNVQDGLNLILSYFNLQKEEFIRRYFSSRKELLSYATTAQSFHRIVSELANPVQTRIVTAPTDKNMLILAGPGSGKTRVIVHRCAYLLRVKRVRAESILICCFNRQAAIDLRRRLQDLVGADGRGVVVKTYHSLAMRLLGYSFAGSRNPHSTAADLHQLIPKAIALLRGLVIPPGLEPDEIRERVLAGFQYILVDEYQDIDQDQYDLISAIAGRTQDDPDQRLSILAVGDDDQNIYSFRGANVQFIRRFREDYNAEAQYLVENYRSTRNIITVSNRLISQNEDRMKTAHPICINSSRLSHPAGGVFEAKDAYTKGRVQMVNLPPDSDSARVVISELLRLKDIGVSDWASVAVLGRIHQDLAQVRSLAEQEGIPIRWWADRDQIPPLHQVREIHAFLEWLRTLMAHSIKAENLITASQPFIQNWETNPWTAFLNQTLQDWKAESSNAELPVSEALEFIWGVCTEARRNVGYGQGVNLSTIHAAKGTEHDHVLLVGSWPLMTSSADHEEARRALYVGMTRARHTLTIFNHKVEVGSLVDTLEGPEVVRTCLPSSEKKRRGREIAYSVLGLEFLFLGYAGLFAEQHKIHSHLSRLQPGEKVELKADGERIYVQNKDGQRVAALSRKAQEEWKSRLDTIHEARVLAVVRRTSEQDQDEQWRGRRQVQSWEVPVVEVVWRDGRLDIA